MPDKKDDQLGGEGKDLDNDIDRAVEELFVPVRTDFVVQEDEEEAPEEEPEPFAEEAEPKTPFDRLKEEMLTLEWELSEDNIRSFAAVLKECHGEAPGNPYVTGVAKMMTGVLKYLNQAKADALAQAPKFLSEATDVMVDVGRKIDDKAQAKKVVEDLMEDYKRLKGQIQRQVKEARPEEAPPEPEAAPEPEPVPEPEVEAVPEAEEELIPEPEEELIPEPEEELVPEPEEELVPEPEEVPVPEPEPEEEPAFEPEAAPEPVEAFEPEEELIPEPEEELVPEPEEEPVPEPEPEEELVPEPEEEPAPGPAAPTPAQLDEIDAQLISLLRLVDNLNKLEAAFAGKPALEKLSGFVADLKGKMKEKVQTVQGLVTEIAQPAPEAPPVPAAVEPEPEPDDTAAVAEEPEAEPERPPVDESLDEIYLITVGKTTLGIPSGFVAGSFKVKPSMVKKISKQGFVPLARFKPFLGGLKKVVYGPLAGTPEKELKGLRIPALELTQQSGETLAADSPVSVTVVSTGTAHGALLADEPMEGRAYPVSGFRSDGRGSFQGFATLEGGFEVPILDVRRLLTS